MLSWCTLEGSEGREATTLLRAALDYPVRCGRVYQCAASAPQRASVLEPSTPFEAACLRLRARRSSHKRCAILHRRVAVEQPLSTFEDLEEKNAA